MKRNIEDNLQQSKDQDELKPLIIRGARQVEILLQAIIESYKSV